MFCHHDDDGGTLEGRGLLLTRAGVGALTVLSRVLVMTSRILCEGGK